MGKRPASSPPPVVSTSEMADQFEAEIRKVNRKRALKENPDKELLVIANECLAKLCTDVGADGLLRVPGSSTVVQGILSGDILIAKNTSLDEAGSALKKIVLDNPSFLKFGLVPTTPESHKDFLQKLSQACEAKDEKALLVRKMLIFAQDVCEANKVATDAAKARNASIMPQTMGYSTFFTGFSTMAKALEKDAVWLSQLIQSPEFIAERGKLEAGSRVVSGATSSSTQLLEAAPKPVAYAAQLQVSETTSSVTSSTKEQCNTKKLKI